MVRNRALKWFLAFLWVGLPVLGFLPGAPVRLTTQWLSVLASLVIIGFSKQGIRNPFRWLILSCVILAILHYKHPNSAYLWAVQSTLMLTSAAMLVGLSKHLKRAFVVCALIQIVVIFLQRFGVNTPFAQSYHLDMAGTVGSIRPASILIALAALWSTGYLAWGLSIAACLTGSGTIVPVIAFRRWWPYRKEPLGWVVGIGLVSLGSKLSQKWLFALSERVEIWATWPLKLWGIGFRAFPGGFQDDTPIGHAMQWRDSHNVILDWVGRFGLPGLLVLLGLGIWIIRRKPDVWTLIFMAWVSCFQSLEQFPVLAIPLLIWLISLAEGEEDAVDSVQEV